MGLFYRLFRPKEVRDILFALDSLDVTPIAENMFYTDMKSRARQFVVNNPEAVRKKVILEGGNPLHIALNLILNFCGRDLGSGIDHSYRGRLGLRGAAKRALFERVQNIMLERGFIEQEDVEYGRKQLEEDIMQAG